MASFDFEIPINLKDLEESPGGNQYVVREVVPVAQLQAKIEQFRVGLSRAGPSVICERFDSFYSLLDGWARASPELVTDAWTQINKTLVKLTQVLPEVIDGGGSNMHRRDDMRVHQNALKMICFVVCQMADKLENRATMPSAATSAKSKKATKKQQQEEWPFHFDWDAEKHKLIGAFTALLRLNLHRLWDPPVVEDCFFNMVAAICFKFFENPNIARAKNIQAETATLVGVCIVRYNQMSSICCRLMQVLAHFEHAVTPLTQLVVALVEKHDLHSIVATVVREIGRIDPEDLIRDTAGSKAYAKFLQDLAKAIPDSFTSSMPMLIPFLDIVDPYAMRVAALGVIGEIYVQRLTKTQDPKARETREQFADILEQHMHDINGLVRSRVFQMWIQASQSNGVLIARYHNLLDLAIGQVMDKSILVRKHAVHLIVNLLRNNPFNSQFEADALEAKCEAEEQKLEEMREAAKKRASLETDKRREDQDEWGGIEDEIGEELAKEGEKQRNETNEEASVKEGESIETVLLRICDLISAKNIPSAIILFKNACLEFPEHPVLHPTPSTNFDETNSEDSDDEDNEKEMTPLSLNDKIVRGLKALYIASRQGTEEVRRLADTAAAEEMHMSEEDIAVKKQEILVLYLKDSLKFSHLIEKCIPSVCSLLASTSASDVTHAVSFFVSAHNFGIRQAIIGIRKMLSLIWSSDSVVKEAVTGAYRDLYLSSPGNPRQRAVAISKNLILLANGATRKESMCLERLVREWIKSGEIDDHVIKVLWERFTNKLPESAPDDVKWSIQLLTMAGAENVEIVKANVDVLLQVGLDPDQEDLEVALATCEALAKLPTKTTDAGESKVKGSASDVPSRYPNDDRIFVAIVDLLVRHFPNKATPHWVPLMEAATRTIYALAENPDLICGDLLRKVAKMVKDSVSHESSQMVASTPKKGGGDCDGDLNSSMMSTVSAINSHGIPAKANVSLTLLKRLVALAGHAAFRQLDHLDRNVAKELKRIRGLMEDKENVSHKQKKKKKKTDEETAEEELGLQGASADDQEAEFIARLSEREIVSPPNLLSAFFRFIVYVCQNPSTFDDASLQTTAVTSLAKYMIVSQHLCQEHLQLFFTILERSSFELVRSNAIVVLTDMAARYPNLIEPWTPHLYARLRDTSKLVRRNTVAVLTHLILHDMVKIKGQISEMAVCLIDDDKNILDSATFFFSELANKGNAIYNILPDIISRLSDPEKGVGPEPFREIMKLIMKYISKDRQKEQLVEKLCQRFRSSKTDQQWRDLAFCISQLSFTEKMIQKLQENFASFADKISDEEVYESFQSVVSNSKKFAKPSTKSLLEEFEAAIDKAHRKGLGDGDEDDGESQGNCGAKLQQAKKSQKPKSKGGTKKKKMEWESDSDDEDDDDDDESEEDRVTTKNAKPSKQQRIPSVLCSVDETEEQPRKTNSRRGGRVRPPPTLESSDDEDELPSRTSSVKNSKSSVKGSVCAAKPKGAPLQSRSRRR